VPALSRLASFWRNLFHRARVERDLDEEVRGFVALLAAEKARAGMNPAAALRAARLEAGGVEQLKEEVRDVRAGVLLDTTVQDLRYAARTLIKNPGFTLVAVLTLALGIGANTAIFSVLYGVLLRPLPYPEADRLVGLADVYLGRFGDRAITYREFQALQTDSAALERSAVWTSVGLNLFAGGTAERVDGLRVSRDYFRTLGVGMALGRDFVAEEDRFGGPNVAILSHGLWRRRLGGDRSVVGRAISMDGAPFTVVGVLPASFRPLEPADVYSTMGQVQYGIGGGENLHFIGRFKGGLTLTQAEARSQPTLAEFRQTFLRDAPREYGIELRPLQALRAAEAEAPIVELFAAVALVLLIACANVAGLVLVRAATRSRELGIRLALGATRRRLTSQLLTESLTLAFLGGAAGAVLARWGLHLLLAIVPPGMTGGADIRLDRWALLFAVGASLASGVVFGLTAAWRAVRADLQGALREGGERTTPASAVGRVRNALAAAEIALSLILLVGAGLLLKSMANLVSTDAGFEPRHVLAAEIWLTGTRYDSTATISGFYVRLIRRLEAQPGIRSAAVVEAGIPLVRGGNLAVAADGVYPRETINYRTVTPGYFETMGIPLEQGRAFSAGDVTGAEPVAVVSESFARRFLGARPLDRMVTVGGHAEPARRVVGVVGDIRQYIGAAPFPTAFLPSAQTPAGLTRTFSVWFPIHVVARTTGEPSRMRAVVERTIRSTDAHVPVGRVRTMDEILSGSVSSQRFVMVLLSAFAALAMMLAAVGIYGVMSYLVAQRAHEIGVRVALGARTRDVLGLVLGRGLALAVAGAALGLLGAVTLTRLMASQLYGIRPTDPLTLAAATLILVLVAMAACYFPARRATKVDPVVALKSE
jgi:putative ABC transport system permease protein